MRISDWSSDVCSSDLGILAEPLVPIEDHGFAALLRHGDGHDLVSELALAPGGGGALVRSDGIGVRLLPRDAIVAGEIFGGLDHARDHAIAFDRLRPQAGDRKSTRLNSSH